MGRPACSSPRSPPTRGASGPAAVPYGARARPQGVHPAQDRGAELRNRPVRSEGSRSHREPWLELMRTKGGAGLNFTSRAEAEVRETLLARLRGAAGSQTAHPAYAGAELQGGPRGDGSAASDFEASPPVHATRMPHSHHRHAPCKQASPAVAQRSAYALRKLHLCTHCVSYAPPPPSQVSIFCDGAALSPFIHTQLDHVSAVPPPPLRARPSTALSSAAWAQLLAARDNDLQRASRGKPKPDADANLRPSSPPPRASTAVPSPRGEPRVAARPPPPPCLLPPRPFTVPAAGSASMGSSRGGRSRGMAALDQLPASPRANSAIAGSRHKQPLGSWAAAAPSGAQAEAAYMPYGLPHETTIRLSVSGFV